MNVVGEGWGHSEWWAGVDRGKRVLYKLPFKAAPRDSFILKASVSFLYKNS